MALGDGIRRNIAHVSQTERDRLRDAFVQLDDSTSPYVYPDGVTFWDKQEEIHKNAHAAGQDVHGGPAFLPWHRELCNRLEALLRQVDPALSLHYWDWTEDPRAASDGQGGTINLFSPQFMGSDQGDAGPPLQNFESTEPGHAFVWRQVAGGAAAPSPPPVAPDAAILAAGAADPQNQQFETFRNALELSHNNAHGYIGGSIGDPHYSFHDPFVFLLHSNVDRLLAKWQHEHSKSWRLDPNQIYGIDETAPSILANLEPWSGGSGLRPWAPPDNQQVVKTPKDPSVVTPPLYDDSLPRIAGAGSNIAQNLDGRLEIFVRGTDSALWHIWQTAPNNGWSGWASLGGILESDPVVFQNEDGRLEVFVRGSDSALWHIWQTAPNNGWSGWASLGGILTSDPAIYQNEDGRLEVFARGTDSALWHIWQTARNNGWSGWASLGGVLQSDPVVCQNADGRLEVFVVGSDSALYHIWQTGPNNGWSGWASLGGILTSRPTIFQNGDGRLEVFAIGTDTALYHIWQTAPNNGWSGWASLGGILTSRPTIFQNRDGRLEVFAMGTDSALWHIWQTAPNNGWSGWDSLGGILTSAPTVFQNLDGRVEVFARGTDSALWHIWQTAPNNGWSSWDSLGGIIAAIGEAVLVG